MTATGFPAHARVTVRLRALPLRAAASETFVAGDIGALDSAEPMRLSWTARFEAGAGLLTALQILTPLTPLEYLLEATVAGSTVATLQFERQSLVAGVA